MKVINFSVLSLWMVSSISLADASKVKRPPIADMPATSDAAATTAEDGSAPKKVRYRAGKAHDFDKTNIDGQVRKPDISVVTGNEQKADNGLLRLRSNFMDRMASDVGEEIK